MLWREEDETLELSLHMITQQESDHLQTKKKTLIKNQTTQHLDLTLYGLQSCEKIDFCGFSYPVYRILLWQATVTKTGNMASPIVGDRGRIQSQDSLSLESTP